VGRAVVADHLHDQPGRHRLVDAGEKPLELDGAVAGGHLGDDVAGGHVERGVQVGDPVADVVVGGSLWVPGSSGRIGAVRSSACTPVFSSTQSTRAAWGGFRYSPTMSRTFSRNCGSVLSLKVSTRCGLSQRPARSG
jgi:hypothetical protein